MASMSAPASLVRDFMTPHVVSVGCETPLDEVMRTLEQRDVSCVLVTDGDAPAGVVSMTDLLRVSAVGQGEPRFPLRVLPPKLRAKDVMKADLVTADEMDDVGEAASKMLRAKVHRLFVRREGRVVGVFSTRDAMRVVVMRHIAAPLGDVMTTPVHTVEIGAPIEDALAKLDAGDVRGLVVVDGPVPVGLFTQLEAIKARALPVALRSRPVEEVTSYETMTLDAATPLYRAAGHATATRVRRILVTQERALVGIVTGYDLARVLIA